MAAAKIIKYTVNRGIGVEADGEVKTVSDGEITSKDAPKEHIELWIDCGAITEIK